MTPLPDNATLLIVDDTHSNLGVAVRMFEEHGYRILTAQDGEEGLQRARHTQPDLILLDVMMPGIDGFEVCRELKADPSTRDIPVLFMTSLASVEHKVKGFQAGAVDYLTKPLQVEEVMARVGTHLKLHAVQKRLEEQNAQLDRHREELEQRVAERTEELSAREREFRTLAENLPDNVARYDRQCRLVYMNTRLEKFLGKTLAERFGKTPLEVAPGGMYIDYQAALQATIETGLPHEMELAFPVGDAEVRYHHIRFDAERDERGEIVSALAIGRDITERKQAERELHLLNRAMDSSSEAAFLSDAQGRFVYVNEEACRSLGYRREELLGKTPVDIDPDISSEALARLLDKIFTDGVTKDALESRHRTRDGRIFPVEIAASPVKLEGANYCLTMVRDITERKKAESILHEQEQAIRAVVENSPDTIIRYDSQCRRIYLNPAIEQVLGQSRAQLLGTSPSDATVLPPQYVATIRKVLESGIEQRMESSYRDGEGKERWVDLRMAPEFGADGKVSTVLVIGRDITERKRAEEELSAREREFRTLAENIPDNIIRYDKNGRKIYLNTATAQLMGVKAEALLNQTPEETPEELRAMKIDEFAQHLQQVLRTGEAQEFELELRHAELGRQVHDVRLVAEHDEQGEIVGALMVGRDITAMKVIENELVEREQRYRQLFEDSPVSIWEEDFSAVYDYFETLRRSGVQDLAGYFDAHPQALLQCVESVRIVDVNQAAVALHQAVSKEALFAGLSRTFTADSLRVFRDELICLWQGGTGMKQDAVVQTLSGEVRHVEVQFSIVPNSDAPWSKILVSLTDITERKQAEAQLRESEEKYRSLIENIQAGVVVHGADTGILICNQVASQLLGLSVDQMLGRSGIDPAWHFFDESGQPLVQADYPVYQVRNTLRPLRSYMAGIHRPGRPHDVWVLVNADPVFGRDGQLLQIIVTFIDVTQRKEAERLLHEQQQAIRAVVDNSPDAISRYDAQLRRIYVNPATEKLYGLSHGRLVGQSLQQLPTAVDDFEFILRAVFDSGQELSIELPFYDAQGNKGWTDIRLVPEFGPDGSVVTVLSIGRDISERKRAEDLLREERGLFVGGPTVVFKWRAEQGWPVEYVSPNVLQQSGYAASEFTDEGFCFADIIHPADLARITNEVATFTAAGRASYEQEYRIRHADCSYRWIYAFTIVQHDEDGEVSHYLGYVMDITERKQVEEELLRYREHLEELVQARTRELQESEAHLRALIDNLPFEFWAMDDELRYSMQNANSLANYGSMVGKSLHELGLPEAIVTDWREKDQRVLDGETFHGQYEKEAGGELRIFDSLVAPVRVGERTIGIVGVSIDITERRRAEEQVRRMNEELELRVAERTTALAASVREFRTLAENIPDTIIRYDREARKTYVNTAVASFIGANSESLIGRTPQQTLPARRADQAEAYVLALARTLDSGEPQELEVELYHAKIGPRTLDIRFVAERDEHGIVVGALMVGRDITAMKAIENELKEREQRYREIFDNAVEGMYLLEVTQDGRFRNIEINPALAASTGIPREAMIGRFVDDAVPEEVGRAIVAKYQRVVAAGETLTEVIELDLPSGLRTYYSTITPIYLGGKVHRLIGISRDITELKRVERELQASREQLRGLAARREEVREEERKYIAREVHDELGQILTGLKMNVSLLQHRLTHVDGELQAHLRDTARLTDRSLEVARNVASALRPAALDMGIASALEWLAQRFSTNTGIACEIVVADNEFALSEQSAIALFRIAQESLTNVARHAQATHIDISVLKDGDDYVLKVRDNGKGFDVHQRKLDSFGVVGMRERALMLGGELNIESRPGQGTSIEVRIPQQCMKEAG